MYQTSELKKSEIKLIPNFDDSTPFAGYQNYAVYCRAFKGGKRMPLFDGYYRHSELFYIS